MKTRWLTLVLVLALAGIEPGSATPANGELRHVATIPLGDVQGRIDHFAVDVEHRRLFVAELGNNSVSVIDLDSATVRQRVFDLPHPQGLAYIPTTGMLYVATGGDGKVRVFAAEDMSLVSTIDIGLDPDNVYASAASGLVAIGFLWGLGVIDASTGRLVRSVPLEGHAEGFQFDPSGTQVMVNLPNKREIVLVDVVEGRVIDHWPTNEIGINFRLAIDEDAETVLIGLRIPEGLGVYSIKDGEHFDTLPLCLDVDDLFVDQDRGLVHAVCGEGKIMTFAREDGGHQYRAVAETPTSAGARTGLFVPELDRLFVAVPARGAEPAGIWVFQPVD